MKIRRALISVSDKTGAVEFARGLREMDVEILSTGGTARELKAAGLTVVEVSDFTGFPEIMDGRVKTLVPRVHGGILCRIGIDDAVMEAHGIKRIDLVVVNFYPFEVATSSPHCTRELAIENIDIGGPAMVRSAGKGAVVVVDPADYNWVITEMEENEGGITPRGKAHLMQKAFARTSAYDATIAKWFDEHSV